MKRVWHRWLRFRHRHLWFEMVYEDGGTTWFYLPNCHSTSHRKQ